LIDYRNEIRNIFGTRGSTPQGTIGEETVGGKNIIRGQDTDRIGGGISTYLEQFSDQVFNWFVQLMYVYYDEPHSASVLGQERAKEYITLVNTELTSSLSVGVKEGSMIPKDMLTRRNEAVDLYMSGKLDPVTAFDRMEFPDPKESAKRSVLYLNDPASYLQEYGPQQTAPVQQQPVSQVPQGGIQLPNSVA